MSDGGLDTFIAITSIVGGFAARIFIVSPWSINGLLPGDVLAALLYSAVLYVTFCYLAETCGRLFNLFKQIIENRRQGGTSTDGSS